MGKVGGHLRISRLVIVASISVVAGACFDFSTLSDNKPGDDSSSDGSVGGDGSLSGNDGGSSSDGSLPGTDGSTSFVFTSCKDISPAPTLCADFDEGSLLAPSFDNQTGNVSLRDGGVSAPSAMLALNLAGTNDAYIEADFDASFANSRTLDFEVRAGFPDGGVADGQIIAMNSAENGTSCGLSLQPHPIGTEFVSLYNPGFEISYFKLGSQLTPDVWTHVTIVLTSDGTHVTAAVSLNGQDAGAGVTSCASMGGPMSFYAGMFQGSGEATFDNVLLRAN